MDATQSSLNGTPFFAVDVDEGAALTVAEGVACGRLVFGVG
jgi:hypothetical protein